jgi:aldose sugar dehydrogenase
VNIFIKFSWRSLALKTIALTVLLCPACSSNAQKNPANYRLVPVVKGLEHPWSMAWLPDRTILVTERPGRLRIVRNGVLDPTSIGGVPAVFASGQGGLMDISLHPQFAKNRLVYLTYAYGTDTANRTRLARAVFDGKNLKNLQVIFEATPVKPGTQHFGSRIAWLPDNTLLLALGDGGNPPLKIEGKLPRFQAQNRRSQLGKVLRLKDDGSIPSDNPFIKVANTNPAIWSYGHRNIQFPSEFGRQNTARTAVTNSTWFKKAKTTAGRWLPIVKSTDSQIEIFHQINRYQAWKIPKQSGHLRSHLQV